MKTCIKFALIFTFNIIGLVGFAQEEQGFGLLFNEEEFSKIPKMPEQTSGTKSIGNLPLSKDLSAYAPTVTQQGKLLSCVAWATAYYAYTIQYAIQHQITDQNEINKIALSAMYPYKKLRPGCEDGLKIEDVARFMKSNGNIPHGSFSVSDCDQKLPAHVNPIIPIKDYQAVFDIKTDQAEKSIRAVLQAIGNNNLPVVVGMEVWDWFRDVKGTDNYYDPKKKGKSSFAHAMTIVGYDLRKKAFKILNSWGEKWGQQGYFWIKFDDFSSVAKTGLILILPEEIPALASETSKSTQVGGTFGFQYLDEVSSDFVKTNPTYAGNGIYQLEKRNWEVGQAFQLLTNNTRSGQSMCVFSINNAGKITLHWPRDEKGKSYLDKDFGLGTGDRLPVKNFDMVIPDPETALFIEEKGSDYLCVLYSDQPLISDLPMILNRIQNNKGDIQSRIREGLGTRLMNAKSITYQSKEMSFSAKSTQGDTVPLILKIDSTEK